jgi:4a-hydroxytetrahydrobiopterin dehydratase
MDIERFGQDPEDRFGFARGIRTLQIRRHDDHAWRLFLLGLEEAEDAETIDARHHQIEEHRRVIVARQLLDRLEPVACAFDLEVLPSKNALHHVADGVIVVDDQNLSSRGTGLLLLGHCNLRAAREQTGCHAAYALGMVPVTLYTRQNCPLCEKAKAAIRASGVAVELTEIDIDQVPALRELYTNDVPVIHVDGKEAFRHSIDPAAFAAYVAYGARSRALAGETCVPCRGGVPPLEGDELRELTDTLGGGWQVIAHHHLEKEFAFPDFAAALAFTNRIGAIAEEQGHHPDIDLAWGKVRVTIWTHKIDGLTRGDFVLAAKIDRV